MFSPLRPGCQRKNFENPMPSSLASTLRTSWSKIAISIPLAKPRSAGYSFISMIRTLSSILFLAAASVASLLSPPQTKREDLQGKTILLFTPHPDDDTFCCAGTLALLAKGGNHIHIVIYTNDDKGSYDPEMTSERLARIRMHEEEEACRIIGIPKENISWLEYHDGLLEYANNRDLVEEVTGIIR